jgi:hypothetical protein
VAIQASIGSVDVIVIFLSQGGPADGPAEFADVYATDAWGLVRHTPDLPRCVHAVLSLGME